MQKRRLAPSDHDGRAPKRADFGLRPAAQALWAGENGPDVTAQGLGALACLPEDVLSEILSLLSPVDLVRSQGVSRAFFAWTRFEAFWKVAHLTATLGRLEAWHGTWRETHLRTFARDPASVQLVEQLETRVCSDFLFQPLLCAAFDPCTIFRSRSFVDHIPRYNVRDCSLRTSSPDLPREPCIFTHAIDHWPAFDPSSGRRWSLDSLAARFPDVRWRAEAATPSMSVYKAYHDGQSHEFVSLS